MDGLSCQEPLISWQEAAMGGRFRLVDISGLAMSVAYPRRTESVQFPAKIRAKPRAKMLPVYDTGEEQRICGLINPRVITGES